jgi:hypothetical protein
VLGGVLGAAWGMQVEAEVISATRGMEGEARVVMVVHGEREAVRVKGQAGGPLEEAVESSDSATRAVVLPRGTV